MHVGLANIAIVDEYLAIGSITAGRANNNCDRSPCSLPHTPPRISESLFITTSMDDHDEEKRRDKRT